MNAMLQIVSVMAKSSDKQEEDKESLNFLTAARRYIGRRQPDAEWHEVQHLQMRLVQIIFDANPTDDWTVLLRDMVNLADKSLTEYEKRWQAVQTIREYGQAWSLAEWQETDETRQVCLTNLTNLMEAFDPSFGRLRDEFKWLGELLNAYTPTSKGKKNAMGAERVLAEIIVRVGGAFGWSVADDEDPIDAVKRIRKLLVREVAEFDEKNNSSRKHAVT